MSTSTRDFTVSSRSCARSGLMVPAPSADLMAAATSSGQPAIQGSAPACSPATSFRLPRASRQALLPAWRTRALGFQASHRAPARLSTVLPAAVSNFRNASTVVLMPTQRWRCPLSCNFAGIAERLQMADSRGSLCSPKPGFGSSCREGQLTDLVANSRNRPFADLRVAQTSPAQGRGARGASAGAPRWAKSLRRRDNGMAVR